MKTSTVEYLEKRIASAPNFVTKLNDDAILTGLTLTENSTGAIGGGVILADTTKTITKTLIRSNSSGNFSGGFLSTAGRPPSPPASSPATSRTSIPAASTAAELPSPRHRQ